MPISLPSISQVLRGGVMPSKKKSKPKEDLSPKASFKRKYGILSKAGKAKKVADRVDSDWGFPLPPKSDPKAKRFARAVISRAHQAKNYDAADVARQVKKAKAILGESGRMREYGMQVAGSWEATLDAINKAVQVDASFGTGYDGGRNYSVSVIASYPTKSAVIIGNYSTGEAWAAKYECDADGNVTFPLVKKAKQTFALAEARRNGIAKIGEAGKAATLPTRKITESIRLFAKVREINIKDDGGITAECVMLQEGPGNAVDGHYYTGDLIDSIVESGIYEGAQSYADHADDVEERATGGVRSVRDLIGWWSDVHVEEADGKKLMVGNFNIETGNDFAQNKMREAKRYAERYKDDPSKQYIGFSIIGGGSSERREINGKPYNVVLEITEAGSTDMVTRAGAGGRLLNLTEADMSTTLASKRSEKKLLESLIDGISKKLRPGLAQAAAPKITEAQFTRALKESGVELDDDAKGKMHAALANVMGGKSAKKTSSDDEDMEDDEMEDSTGDPSLDDILEPDDSDEDDDDDETKEDDVEDEDADLIGGESKRKKESGTTARERELLRENAALKLKEKARSLRETARTLVTEAKVPAAMRKDVLTYLVEQCRSEKAMRAYLGTIKPLFAESAVNGNPWRTRESGARGTGLLTVSGVEKAG